MQFSRNGLTNDVHSNETTTWHLLSILLVILRIAFVLSATRACYELMFNWLSTVTLKPFSKSLNSKILSLIPCVKPRGWLCMQLYQKCLLFKASVKSKKPPQKWPVITSLATCMSRKNITSDYSKSDPLQNFIKHRSFFITLISQKIQFSVWKKPYFS